MQSEIEFARSILENSQQLNAMVDVKAGILLAADAAVLAILGVSQTAMLGQPEEVAYLLSIILVLMSALTGAMTIKARRIGGTPPTRIFFGKILERTREEYLRSFPSSEQEILDDYLNNIYTIAQIQEKKFRYLNTSLYMLSAAFVPLLVLVAGLHS